MFYFKVFTEIVTILLLFDVLVFSFFFSFYLRGMWDPRSLIRDQTLTHCVTRRILNHWTTGGIPMDMFLSDFLAMCIFVSCI